MKLNFLGSKCLEPQSMFSFLIKFMLSHSHALEHACSLCPFGYCYKYFIGTFAAIQIVHASKELSRLFKVSSADEHDDSEQLLMTIPYLNVPVTHHNFDIIRHTLCLSSSFDLLLRTLMSETVEELISFTFISLLHIAYSWLAYCAHFNSLPTDKRVIHFVMNVASLLNLAFLMCFIFESYKNCTNLH